MAERAVVYVATVGKVKTGSGGVCRAELKPSIFGLMCKELVVAPCIDLFASYRHHQLPRYYLAYADDSTALGQNAFAYVWDRGYACMLTRHGR